MCIRDRHMAVREYHAYQPEVWPVVTAAFERLRAQYDLVVMEGAGSPAEVNLRGRDIVNMKMALYARSPALLVGDIDRGGVFASLVGHVELFTPCLLYTSDAADDLLCVDLGGRRTITKKTQPASA